MSTGTPQGPYYPSPYNPPPSPPPPPGYGPGPRRRASMYGGRPPSGRGPTRPGPSGWLRKYGPYVALGLVVLVSGVLG